MNYTEEEIIEFWKRTGNNTYVWCEVTLITEETERVLISNHFTYDTNTQYYFTRIVNQLETNNNKCIPIILTNCTIEYRVWINEFPNAIIRDHITEALSLIGQVFKGVKIRLTLFFANTAFMMVKRLTDWVRELRGNYISVVIGPVLVSQSIEPPSDTTDEVRQDRMQEDSLLLRKLWGTLVSISRNVSSEKVIFLSEYSGSDYSANSVNEIFSIEQLYKFYKIVKTSMLFLSENQTANNLKNKLKIGFPPFCFIFKLEWQTLDSFSKTLFLEPTLMKYGIENSVFNVINETVKELCIELKKTKLYLRRVQLILNLVSEQARLATVSLWNVVEEIQLNYSSGKSVKSIMKGVENLMKNQPTPKNVSMETHRNAEYELHKLNQSAIDLDWTIRELNIDTLKYSKFSINFEEAFEILTKLETNFEGIDLLLVLEKTNLFCVLSASYEASVYLSKQQVNKHGIQTNNTEIENILSRLSKETKWISTQLELKQELVSKSDIEYVVKKHEFTQMLRKNKSLRKQFENELEFGKGCTPKGELNQLLSFSSNLRCELDKDTDFKDSKLLKTKPEFKISCPNINTNIEAYLDLIYNSREDTPKRISELAANIQLIEEKLKIIAKILFLDSFR